MPRALKVRLEWRRSRVSGRAHAFEVGDDDSLCGTSERQLCHTQPAADFTACRSCALLAEAVRDPGSVVGVGAVHRVAPR